MENKIKGYMDRIKHSASQLINDRDRPEEESAPAVMIDTRDYEFLRQRADRMNTTPQALVNRAVKQFIEQQSRETRSQVSVEQKERNPLLLLDALTQSLD